ALSLTDLTPPASPADWAECWESCVLTANYRIFYTFRDGSARLLSRAAPGRRSGGFGGRRGGKRRTAAGADDHVHPAVRRNRPIPRVRRVDSAGENVDLAALDLRAA